MSSQLLCLRCSLAKGPLLARLPPAASPAKQGSDHSKYTKRDHCLDFILRSRVVRYYQFDRRDVPRVPWCDDGASFGVGLLRL